MEDFSDIEESEWSDKPSKYDQDNDQSSFYEGFFSRESESIDNHLEKETCEECNTRLVPVIKPIIQTEGVGPTYAQAHPKSFSIMYDIVCPKCGLVYGSTTKIMDQSGAPEDINTEEYIS